MKTIVTVCLGCILSHFFHFLTVFVNLLARICTGPEFWMHWYALGSVLELQLNVFWPLLACFTFWYILHTYRIQKQYTILHMQIDAILTPQEKHTFQLVEIKICWYIANYQNIYQNTCQYGGESQEDVYCHVLGNNGYALNSPKNTRISFTESQQLNWLVLVSYLLQQAAYLHTNILWEKMGSIGPVLVRQSKYCVVNYSRCPSFVDISIQDDL